MDTCKLIDGYLDLDIWIYWNRLLMNNVDDSTNINKDNEIERERERAYEL